MGEERDQAGPVPAGPDGLSGAVGAAASIVLGNEALPAEGVAVITLDVNGTVVSWNERAALLRGWAASEIVGRPLWVTFPPEDPELAGGLAQLLAEARQAGGVEVQGWRVRSDGSRFRAQETLSSLCDRDGAVTGYAVVVRGQPAFNRAQSEIVSMVAHDLRTPITVIGGFADTLIERGDAWDVAARERALRAIGDSATRLGRLVEGILQVASAEAGVNYHPQSLDLVALAAKAVESVIGPDPASTVRVEPYGDIPPVWADEERCWQVLTNLVSNAVRHGAGTPVTVRFYDGDDAVHVVVSNMGESIPPEEQGRLFERFERGRAAEVGRAGFGLGLWICRQLVEAQGGRVWVKSAPGLGTAFGFSLPVPPTALGAAHRAS
jgi:PAS domain S-box-containing protein